MNGHRRSGSGENSTPRSNSPTLEKGNGRSNAESTGSGIPYNCTDWFAMLALNCCPSNSPRNSTGYQTFAPKTKNTECTKTLLSTIAILGMTAASIIAIVNTTQNKDNNQHAVYDLIVMLGAIMASILLTVSLLLDKCIERKYTAAKETKGLTLANAIIRPMPILISAAIVILYYYRPNGNCTPGRPAIGPCSAFTAHPDKTNRLITVNTTNNSIFSQPGCWPTAIDSLRSQVVLLPLTSMNNSFGVPDSNRNITVYYLDTMIGGFAANQPGCPEAEQDWTVKTNGQDLIYTAPNGVSICPGTDMPGVVFSDVTCIPCDVTKGDCNPLSYNTTPNSCGSITVEDDNTTGLAPLIIVSQNWRNNNGEQGTCDTIITAKITPIFFSEQHNKPTGNVDSTPMIQST